MVPYFEASVTGGAVWGNENTLAFLDIEPATRGHTLVIPKSHHVTLTDMPEDLVADVFRTVQRVAAALESTHELDGFNIAQSNGSTRQEVFHAHVHIIPRYEDDNVDLGWSPKDTDETTQQEIAASLRGELDLPS